MVDDTCAVIAHCLGFIKKVAYIVQQRRDYKLLIGSGRPEMP